MTIEKISQEAGTAHYMFTFVEIVYIAYTTTHAMP